MTNSLPSVGEVERNLSQSIQAFYRHQLGCRTEKVSCHIIDMQIVIAIKNPITPVEKLLNNHYDAQFISDLRDRIDVIIKQELLSLVETVLGIKVAAITIDTALDNNFTGIIVLLSELPSVRRTKGKSRLRN
ncbi:MAG: Na-translocating system protein MpsC family protein [Cyanobacteria bacterium J06621_8]